MAGRKRKLSTEAVMEVRAWWKLKRSIPTRRQMCAKYGVSITTLIQAAHGFNYKEVRDA